MTLGQMIKKYKGFYNRKIEYVSLHEVMGDLAEMRRHQQLLKIPKEQR